MVFAGLHADPAEVPAEPLCLSDPRRPLDDLNFNSLWQYSGLILSWTRIHDFRDLPSDLKMALDPGTALAIVGLALDAVKDLHSYYVL